MSRVREERRGRIERMYERKRERESEREKGEVKVGKWNGVKMGYTRLEVWATACATGVNHVQLVLTITQH